MWQARTDCKKTFPQEDTEVLAHAVQGLWILRMKPQAVWSDPLADSAVSSSLHQTPPNLLPQWSSQVFVISMPVWQEEEAALKSSHALSNRRNNQCQWLPLQTMDSLQIPQCPELLGFTYLIKTSPWHQMTIAVYAKQHATSKTMIQLF